MKSQRVLINQLAGVEYYGISGSTADCLRAIARLIYMGESIRRAYLVTFERTHAFILFNEVDDIYVIKDGFASGYAGEGPKGLSAALRLLAKHKAVVEEYEVDSKFMERLERSALLQDDIDSIESTRPMRPRRIGDYEFPPEIDFIHATAYLSLCLPPSVPFGLIDERIMDLAVSFQDDHDTAIVAAYRRLEDIVRTRTKISDSGTKLFSRAFLSPEAPLTWKVDDVNESKSRANLFTAVFGAFRNARMHREQQQSIDEALREFLLVNELFLLEASSICNPQRLHDLDTSRSGSHVG